MLKKKKSKAQSIMEYLLVLGGIILAIVIGSKYMAQGAKGQMQTAGQLVNFSGNKVAEKLGMSSSSGGNQESTATGAADMAAYMSQDHSTTGS